MAGFKLNADENGPVLVEDASEALVGATVGTFSVDQLEPIVKMLLTASPIMLTVAKLVHVNNPLFQHALDVLPQCVDFLRRLDAALNPAQ